MLALRGDPPRGVEHYDRSADAFRYAADLVACIREYNESGRHPDPDDFAIGVAGFPEGHPSTPNRLREMDFLKAKVDAGADYICTQLFFDNHCFLDYRERCLLAGIKVPVLAGIMPVTSLSGMNRMAELSGGTCFPARLLKALKRAGASGSHTGSGHPVCFQPMRGTAGRRRGRHPFLHAQPEPRHPPDLPESGAERFPPAPGTWRR